MDCILRLDPWGKGTFWRFFGRSREGRLIHQLRGRIPHIIHCTINLAHGASISHITWGKKIHDGGEGERWGWKANNGRKLMKMMKINEN